MAALHIREVSEAQMKAIRLSAAREGMTVRGWVLAMLLDGDPVTAGEPERPPAAPPVAAIIEKAAAPLPASPQYRRPEHTADTCRNPYCPTHGKQAH